MRIAIIDYGSGNLRSVEKAFERVSSANNSDIMVTSDASELAKATHIVLPGVGAFADCMQGLNNLSGMRDALEQQVTGSRKPFLGICVGMQMLFDTGFEHGEHKGLGWLSGEIRKIERDSSFKIPHMGWNDLHIKSQHPLLDGIKSSDHAYFVHSYHAICKNPSDVRATTDYGGEITAVVASGNIMGTQFHPEKSQEAGLRLIKNFLQIC